MSESAQQKPASKKPASKRKSKTGPKKRANGIAAREKILEAAAEIAAERGYEGTSISLVSKRSGLPASSIYWHFKNKDDLITAVIEQSFEAWLAALPGEEPLSGTDTLSDFVTLLARQSLHAIEEAPDFLRLGLMLALGRKLKPCMLSVADGRWERPTLTGTGLRGKTVGVIGFGAIGAEVASLCQNLGMNVLVASSTKNEESLGTDDTAALRKQRLQESGSLVDQAVSQCKGRGTDNHTGTTQRIRRTYILCQ